MSTSLPQPDHSRRQLIGSWLDWIEFFPEPFSPHQLDLASFLEAARSLRTLTAQWGWESVVVHRAQAALLAGAKPGELFTLLTTAAEVLETEDTP